MSGYEREDWEKRVRKSDPDTSKEAAKEVNVENDRKLVYRPFYAGLRLTARQAAVLVAPPNAPVERLESLRRRVSDLETLGLIEPVGKQGRQRLLAKKVSA